MRADRDLAPEFESISGRLAQQFDRDRQLVTDTLRGASEGLAVDGEVDDETIPTGGILVGGVADVERRRADRLALARLLQDDVGIAVHQPVDCREIPYFVGAGSGLRRELDLGKTE